MNAYNCVKCSEIFVSERRLVLPVFCPDCLEEIWTDSVRRGNALNWYDSPTVQAETPADQHLRATGAPRLFGDEP